MNPSRKSLMGFTLLEVLVALAILAIAASGLLYSTNENLKNAEYLESKTLATWIAQNKIADLSLLESRRIRTSTELVIFAGRDWDVEVELMNSTIAQLQAVKVKVNLQGDYSNNNSLIDLTVYFGEGNENN